MIDEGRTHARSRSLSIQGKIALLAAATTLVVTSAFAIVYSIATRATAMREVQGEAEASADRLRRSLAVPLWGLDQDTCRALAAGELNGPDIRAVLILDETGSQVAFSARPVQTPNPFIRMEPDPAGLAATDHEGGLSRSGAVYHAGRRIGDVRVFADYGPALRRIASRVLLATATAFLVGAAISAALYFAVNRVVTARLHRLAGILDRFAARDLAARSADSSGDVVGELGASFNAMAGTIEAYNRELLARTEEVRLLLDRVESEREDERTRIARELHDQFGQGIASLGMALYLLERRLGDGGSPASLEKIGDMRAIITELNEEMKRLVSDLRPSVLDRLGLSEALAYLAEESTARTGIRVDFGSTVPASIVMPEAAKTAAYRVAQEALSNALKHSRSERIRISLASGDGRLRLDVEDAGVGFSPAGNGTGGFPRSFGLIGMRERCLALGGELCVVSVPGEGTRVTATFPVTGGRDDAHPDRR